MIDHETDAADQRVVLDRNLTQGMVDSIGRLIVTGGYTGRVFPTEAELARRYGVSRSVTREAVKMLIAKGLLSTRPSREIRTEPQTRWSLFDIDVQRWFLDRQFSLDMLRQYTELRLAIEPYGAEIAARSDDVAAKAAIGCGLERIRAADAGMDDKLDAEIAFHTAVMRASGNPFYTQLQSVVGTARYGSQPASTADILAEALT